MSTWTRPFLRIFQVVEYRIIVNQCYHLYECLALKNVESKTTFFRARQIVNKTTIRNMESSWEKVQGLHLVEAVTIVTIVTVIFAHMVEKGLVIRIEVSK